MFDPNFIGKVEAENVRVEEVLPSLRHVQCFRAVVTLQEHQYRLLLKPYVGGKRDQIVADRLKYLFGLKPMHVFGLSLNFLYRQGERYDCDWIEYFAISMGNKLPTKLSHKDGDKLPTKLPHKDGDKLSYSVWQTLAEIRSTSLVEKLDFQIELCKIVMFRYVIGTSQTCDEHILVRLIESEDHCFEILSISETVITSLCPARTFLDSLRFISPEAWQKAQVEILKHFDYDYERGIILQTRKLELELKGRRAQGTLTMKPKDIAACIEDRISLVTTCDVNRILDLMRGQSF